MNTLLEGIFNEFQVQSKYQSYQELNSGHINDTYLIETFGEPNYVLQKINGNVFKDAKNLVKNKVLVSAYLQDKFAHLSEQEISRKVLCFVKTKRNTFFYEDEFGGIWNLSIYIENTTTYLKTPSSKIAYEAGKATGFFLESTTDFDASKLVDILPQFHSVSYRYKQFKEALSKATNEAIEEAKFQIEFVEKHISEMLQIDKAIQHDEIQLRLTHSDTKISNILFSNEQALCLIDTDTVMNGVIHFDYGDAIRTICATANEDEKDIALVDFNLDFFKSYTQGFFSELKNISEKEIYYLATSVKMMPFIMGARFLTDFLNGNVYYKVAYENHNLDRAKNQFAYVNAIIKKYSKIEAIIGKEFS